MFEEGGFSLLNPPILNPVLLLVVEEPNGELVEVLVLLETGDESLPNLVAVGLVVVVAGVLVVVVNELVFFGGIVEGGGGTAVGELAPTELFPGFGGGSTFPLPNELTVGEFVEGGETLGLLIGVLDGGGRGGGCGLLKFILDTATPKSLVLLIDFLISEGGGRMCLGRAGAVGVFGELSVKEFTFCSEILEGVVFGESLSKSSLIPMVTSTLETSLRMA